MNIQKLTSTTKFVLQHRTRMQPKYLGMASVLYATFLTRPLEIGIFVPLLNEVIFEYPVHRDYSTEEDYNIDMEAYQKAKKKVLLTGFEPVIFPAFDTVFFQRGHHILFYYKDGRFYGNGKQLRYVEDLLFISDITLTEAATESIFTFH